MNTHDKYELPPLPPLNIAPSVEPVDYPKVAQALMDYARAAIEADRKRRDDLEAQLEKALTERDDYHDIADQLAEQIAAITDHEIGEHSSGNNPWQNAMLAADEWIAKDIRRLTDGIDRQRRGEPVNLDRYDAGLLGGQDGMPAYVWHDIIRAELDRAYDFYMDQLDRTTHQPAEPSRSEPVGYIMPTALKQLKAGGNAIVGGVSQGFDVPIYTAPQPAEPVSQHPDDAAVDAFAAAMKAKLKRAREEKGRGGWQDMSAAELSAMLREHVEKGDPVDVANLAMMLSLNGQRIAPDESVKVPSDEEILEVWYASPGGTIEYEVIEFARALLARYGQPTQPFVPLEKTDPWYEEGSTDVFDHAQRQAYVDGWNACREAILKET